MDESGIIGQMILDNSGAIKSSNGTLQNGEMVQQIKVIVASTAKLIDKNNNQLNRVTSTSKQIIQQAFKNLIQLFILIHKTLQYQKEKDYEAFQYRYQLYFMLIFLHLYFSCYRAQIYPIKCDGFEPIIHFLEEECLSLSFPFSALNYHDGEIWILQEEYCDQIEDGQCEIQYNDKYHFVKQLQVLPQDMYGKTQQETLIYMEFDKNQHADQLKCHGYISLTPNQYLPNFIFDKNLNLCLDLEIGFFTKESIYLPDQYVSINFEKDSPNYIIQSSKLIINQKSFEIFQYKTVIDSSDQLQFPEEIFTEISIIFINMGFQLINGYLMIQSDIQINGILPIIKIEIEGQQLDIHPYNYFKTNYNNWGYDIIMIANSNNVFSQNQLILGKPFLINRMINIDLLNYQIKLIDNINCQNYLQQVIYEREKYWLLLSLVLFFITSYLLYRKSMKLEQIKRETHMELTEI